MKRDTIHLILYIGFIFSFLGLYSCKSAKLSDADAAFERGEYFDAQKIYRKYYNKLTKREERPQRGEIAYKLGLCYDKLNMASRASASFQNAIRYEYPDSTAYLLLGKSLHAEGKYAPALDAYTNYLFYQPDDLFTKEAMKGCRMAIASKDAPKTRYVVKNAKLFNSRRSDFSPMFLDKTYDQLFFTTTNEKVTGENKSEITGMKKGDIYFSKKNERGQWQQPEPAEGELNTDADEGIISFSPDGQTMYLTRATRSETSNTTVEIYTSRRSDASWSAPQKFEILNDSITAVGHPAVSADGSYLYFTSDMPGGYGGLDIWRININDRVGTLENLGPQINTPGDEMFPYSRTDSLFYFASNGHPG